MKRTTSLTDFEYKGLLADISLADGHAYQDLHSDLMPVVRNLEQIWNRASRRKIPEVEAEFGATFGRVAGSKALAAHRHFRICPTASNSIDLAATWLTATGKRTMLLEPTFDNLALIMHRRAVQLERLNEQLLHDSIAQGTLTSLLTQLGIEALFLVNPNNPTGAELTADQFYVILDTCVRNDITLILDCTFRFFTPNEIDHYDLLLQSGVSFIVIEDTGKTWPTQDMKASMICFSSDISSSMNMLYEEIYLCVSPFTLEFMIEMISRSGEIGFQSLIWDLIAERRSVIRSLLKDSVYMVDPNATSSKLSVEWLRCRDDSISDIFAAEYMSKSGVSILPGRYFYWSAPTDAHNQHNIRISLMKSAATFQEGARRLKAGLEGLTASASVGHSPAIAELQSAQIFPTA